MNTILYRRAADLMEAELGDELVGLDITSGRCFGFNSVATSVWRHLAEPRTFEHLRDALSSEYDVEAAQCSTELEVLLREMVERGLVIRDEPAAARNI